MAKIFLTLVIVCVVGAVLVEGLDKQAANAQWMIDIQDCKAKTGAKDDDVDELLRKEDASTMEGKCLGACIMDKYGLMDGNGKFVKSVALDHAKKYTDGAVDTTKIAHAIIEACVDIEVPADHCEAAEQYAKCLKRQAETRGLRDKLEF